MKSVKPKKHLGQHFLTDLGIARRIADTVDACPEIPVLEIGPGMGVLTQYLVEKPREVKAVEIDKESVAYLYDRFPKLRDNIIGDDFLRMDLTTLFDGRPFVLTGNYPYDISSQIFFKMLDNKELIPCCTGMIQREVALRMAAAPGSKAYGILSVLTQAWYDVEYLFTVDETVFNPPPQGQERRDPHDAQRRPGAGLRRAVVQAAGQGRLQPAAQDAARQPAPVVPGPAPRGRLLPARHHDQAARAAQHRPAGPVDQ